MGVTRTLPSPASAPLPPSAEVVRRGIDGKSWTALAPFQRADGRGPARWTTAVELCWDESHLHVRFRCEDHDAWSTFTERDAPLWQQEVVELFLAPGDEVPKSYFEFEISPAGVLFDARVVNPHGDRLGMTVDMQWNCAGVEWSASPAGEKQNWLAELSLPWRGLDLSAAPERLRANFFRIERPRGGEAEFSCWSPTFTSPADFHRPERFGNLSLIG
ncbi:MAG: carbohydrate-binding family 9-like protein [Thermoanaerobaculia bacterium]